jgi:hypothetical protein
METAKNTHGGKRPGAGRTPGVKNTKKSISITPDALEILINQGNQSQFISQAIIEKAKREKAAKS